MICHPLCIEKDRLPLIPVPFPALSILDPDLHACEYSLCFFIDFVIIVAVCVCVCTYCAFQKMDLHTSIIENSKHIA